MGNRRARVAALGRTTPSEADRNWPLVVRRARATDREGVLAFATQTWDGWDYIPHAWPVWLDATDGLLLVASAGRTAGGGMPVGVDGQPLGEDQPIAISRVALLSVAEGWVEGIRVDPRVRGLGVATDLQTAELHWLAAHAPEVTRYATGARNEGSHRLGARHGFELLTRFRTLFWRDPSKPADDTRDEANGFDEPTRLAASRRRRELLARLAAIGLRVPTAETDRWWQRVLGDVSFAAGGGLYELRSWAVQELTAPAFAAHVAAGEVVALDRGAGWALALIPAEALPAEDVSIHLALVAGQPTELLELVTSIQRLAAESIRFRLTADAMPADHDAAFNAAGFEARPWELHILARPGDSPPPAVERARLVFADAPHRVIRPPRVR